MKKTLREYKKRNLEKERKELLETMAKYISDETQSRIDDSIEAMNNPCEYRITISHTGAGNANDQ